jgi:hypothetical protein
MRESQIVQEWQAQARAEEARAALLEALKVRFSAEVPADLRGRIEAESDLLTLKHWFPAALTANTLADFRAVVVADNDGAAPPRG